MIVQPLKSWVIAGFIALFFLPLSCINYKYSDKRTVNKLKKEGNKVEVLYRSDENARRLRYVVAYQPQVITRKAVLFIHGSPGSSKDFKQYLSDPNLAQRAHLYALDRPGYGASDWGNLNTSIYQQSLSLLPLIDSLGDEYDTLVVVGHSYGGPVAAAIPLMRPESVQSLLLIAPALDPKLERIFWFTPIGKASLTRWLTPRALQMAADEKYEHAKELEILWDKLENKSFYGNVIHLHGTKDWVVDYENTRFSRRLYKRVKIKTVKDGNHYIPFNEYDLTVEALNALTN